MPILIDKFEVEFWRVISVVNGNPEYSFSAPRFLMAMFFLYLLYSTIRMRAMAQFRQHQIVALIGCVLMFIREATMLICIGGWEMKLFTDQLIHFLWPPIEHAFETAAYLCFAWYTIEASQWSVIRRFARRTIWYFVAFISLFSIYALVGWKAFFLSSPANHLYAYKHFSADWQSHLIISFISLTAMLAAWMRQKGTSYLLMFWFFVSTEHITRTIVFAFFDEQAWQATIFHTIHTWSLPLLLLHFINAYVSKMGHCIQCQREVAFENEVV